MHFKIEEKTDLNEISQILAESILKQLKDDKKVLWFATGGSSIAIASLVSKILIEHPHHNLTVMLTDERYGELNHPDSNWAQLLAKGFVLPEAKLIPILTGDDRDTTVFKFNQNIKEEFENADYKIGLFGVGADGHTAGMLPASPAVNSEDLAFGYNSEKFERITMTPKAIKMLDEAFVYMIGENKWGVVDDLKNKDLPLETQPAQILKQIPLLTIFSDYNK